MKSMILKAGFVFTALAFLLSTSGHAATTSEKAEQYVDDSTITASVKTKLVADKLANFTGVHVKTTKGVVSLSGTVESAEQKRHAEQIVMQVKGVERVENELQIQNRN